MTALLSRRCHLARVYGYPDTDTHSDTGVGAVGSDMGRIWLDSGGMA